MSRSSISASIILLFSCVALVGCSDSRSATAPTSSAVAGHLDSCVIDRQPDDPDDVGDGQVHDYIQGAPAFQDLVNQSDLVIIGEVESVGNARWNSASGEQWCSPDRESKVMASEQQKHAFRYRPVVIRVSEVIFDRANKVQVGEKVELVFPPPGGANKKWELADRVSVSVETRNATPPVGSQVIQVADRKSLEFEASNSEVLSADLGSLGWWAISSEIAMSEIPGRTAPLDQLRKRLLDLRDAGPISVNNEAAEKSRVNPLS